MAQKYAFIKDGYACFFPAETKTLHYLDARFKNWAIQFGGKEFFVPALIDKVVLEKCGYFKSFPQHITVVGFMRNSACSTVSAKGDINPAHIEVGNKFLTPAACLHIYPMYEDKPVSANEVVTTLARVYRYERGQFHDIIRLWDFTVRELVFMGSSDFVLQKLEEVKAATRSFLEQFGIPYEVEKVSDHFFPSRENLIKAKIQKANSLKSEVHVMIEGEQVSLCSFNFHGNHFSKTFNFDNNGKIVTGCVGFGLERWVAAFKAYDVNTSGLKRGLTD